MRETIVSGVSSAPTACQTAYLDAQLSTEEEYVLRIMHRGTTVSKPPLISLLEPPQVRVETAMYFS